MRAIHNPHTMNFADKQDTADSIRMLVKEGEVRLILAIVGLCLAIVGIVVAFGFGFGWWKSREDLETAAERKERRRQRSPPAAAAAATPP